MSNYKVTVIVLVVGAVLNVATPPVEYQSEAFRYPHTPEIEFVTKPLPSLVTQITGSCFTTQSYCLPTGFSPSGSLD